MDTSDFMDTFVVNVVICNKDKKGLFCAIFAIFICRNPWKHLILEIILEAYDSYC